MHLILAAALKPEATSEMMEIDPDTPCFGLTLQGGYVWMRSCGDLQKLDGLPTKPPRSSSVPAGGPSMVAAIEKDKFDNSEAQCPIHGPMTWNDWRAKDHERQMAQFREIWKRRHGPTADEDWAAQKTKMEKRLAEIATRPMTLKPADSPLVRSPLRHKRRLL